MKLLKLENTPLMVGFLYIDVSSMLPLRETKMPRKASDPPLLVDMVLPSADHHDPDKVIFNFSSCVLTEDEKQLLCKGLNFVVPPHKIDYADYMMPFELLYRDIKKCAKSTQSRKYIQARLRKIAFVNFDSFNRHQKCENNLTDGEFNALNELAKREILL